MKTQKGISWKVVFLVIPFFVGLFWVWMSFLKEPVTQWYENNNIESYTKEYKENCEQGDYAKAYEVCKKMERYKSTADDEKYIVMHEATSILENQGIEGLVKISFIAKEHKAGWLYEEMLSLAKNMGNNELVIAMMEKWTLWDDNIVRAMISEGKKEAVFALLQSLGTFSMPEIGIEYHPNDFKKILSKISTYNNRCKLVVESAIMYKQKEIALSAIMLMKPKIFYRENNSDKFEVHEPRNDGWHHEDPNEDINAMKAKVAEAEKSGMFK